jgi:uncharacterized phage-associated protein
MRFRYNKIRTAQAIALLVRLNGSPINKMKLIKLLYLVDREALIHGGAPLTGDQPYAMKFGPVLSTTLDHLNYGDPLDPFWDEHIQEANHSVRVERDPGDDELSKQDHKLIVEVFERFKGLTQFELAEWCHQNLPEWSDPGSTAARISFESILEAAGKSPEEIQRISQESDYYAEADKLLGAA